MASRRPALVAAGTEASRCAIRPIQPVRPAKPSSRRCRSVGTSRIRDATPIRISAITAGISVIVIGASPGKMPKRRPRPQITTAIAYGK